MAAAIRRSRECTEAVHSSKIFAASKCPSQRSSNKGAIWYLVRCGCDPAPVLQHKIDFSAGKLEITEFLFEVPENYVNPKDGVLRLFARSAEKVEKPADSTKDEKKQLPWCTLFPARTAI